MRFSVPDIVLLVVFFLLPLACPQDVDYSRVNDCMRDLCLPERERCNGEYPANSFCGYYSAEGACWRLCLNKVKYPGDVSCWEGYKTKVLECMRAREVNHYEGKTPTMHTCESVQEPYYLTCRMAGKCGKNMRWNTIAKRCDCVTGFKYVNSTTCVPLGECYGSECALKLCSAEYVWDEEDQRCVKAGEVDVVFKPFPETVYSNPKHPDTYFLDVQVLPSDSAKAGYFTGQAASIDLAFKVKAGGKTKTVPLETLRIGETRGRKPRAIAFAYGDGVTVRMWHPDLDRISDFIESLNTDKTSYMTASSGLNFMDLQGQVYASVQVRDEAGENLATVESETPVFKYRIRKPVLFVPGIGGSILAVDGNKRWPGNPLAFHNRGHWNTLRLNQDGSGKQAATPDIVHSVLWRWSVYKPFIEFLDLNGYESPRLYLTYPYDWRLDNRKHVDGMKNMMGIIMGSWYDRGDGYESRKPTDKVIVVAHSMGGLVTRAYLEKYGIEDVEMVVMMGTPNHGAPQAFTAIAGEGYNFGNSLLQNSLAKEISQNWPAAHQLLPQYDYHYNETGSLMKRRVVYEDYHSFIGRDNRFMNKMLLRDADEFHKEISGFPQGLPLFIIAGHDVMTTVGHVLTTKTVEKCCFFGQCTIFGPELMEYEVLENDKTFIRYCTTVEGRYYRPLRSDCGDGTVPLDSTVLPNARMIYAESVGHMDLMGNPLSLHQLKMILEGKIPETGVKPCDSRYAITDSSL